MLLLLLWRRARFTSTLICRSYLPLGCALLTVGDWFPIFYRLQETRVVRYPWPVRYQWLSPYQPLPSPHHWNFDSQTRFLWKTKKMKKKIKHFGDASLIWVNLLPNSMARHGLEGHGLGIVHFIQRRVKKATNWDKFDLLRLLVWGGIHCKYQNGSSLLTRKAFRAENRSVIYTCRHILPGAILSTKHLFQLLSSYGHSNKNSINIISNNILWCLLRSVLIVCLEKFFILSICCGSIFSSASSDRFQRLISENQQLFRDGRVSEIPYFFLSFILRPKSRL